MLGSLEIWHKEKSKKEIMKWSKKESSQKNRNKKRKEETLECLQGTQECEVTQFEQRTKERKLNKSLNQVYSISIKILVGFPRFPNIPNKLR